MKEESIANSISGLLPDRNEPFGAPRRDEAVRKEASRVKAKSNAKELARKKYEAARKIQKVESLQQEADRLGIDPSAVTSRKQLQTLAAEREKVKTIEAIESATVLPLQAAELPQGVLQPTATVTTEELLRLQGTTRPEIAKLLTTLDINLSVQLTKQDTANLLACLLTCNETQLNALYKNAKVPIAIKTVIRRLLEDSRLGNIDTVDKLWDRVFGKGPLQMTLPETQQLQTGILPDIPVSREAYVLIRDKFFK